MQSKSSRNRSPKWEREQVRQLKGLNLPRDEFLRLRKERLDKRCRECGKDVPGRRRTWCSDECVEHHLVCSSTQHARVRLIERDEGICEHCGIDCLRIEAEAAVARAEAQVLAGRDKRNILRWKTHNHLLAFKEYERHLKSLLEPILSPVGMMNYWKRTSFWDADHIVPVSEGGMDGGLDNLQTLCLKCHKGKTNRGQTRRRIAKKAGKPIKRLKKRTA